MNNTVKHIRKAARQLVRELHLLDGRHCIEGFSYSECHLVSELGTLHEASAKDLGERLVLEKSTMSRLVNSMLGRGYLSSRSDPEDGRRRLLSLTEKGLDGARRINRYAIGQVSGALEFVPFEEQQEIVKGIGRYAKALRYSRLSTSFHIRPIQKEDNPAVADIIRRVMTEFGAVGCDYSISDPEVDAMYQAYRAPQATFYVIESEDQLLGCGGMAPLKGGEPGVCELQKMYFLPELRGTGLGSLLLKRILEDARKAGYSRCYLETLERMDAARRLYAKHGFHTIDQSMGHTGHSGCNSWMLRLL